MECHWAGAFACFDLGCWSNEGQHHFCCSHCHSSSESLDLSLKHDALIMLYRPCCTLNHPEEPGQGLCILCILHFQQMGFEACKSVISNFGTLDRQRTIISMNFGAFLDHLVGLCHLSRLNSRVLWASSWLPPIF